MDSNSANLGNSHLNEFLDVVGDLDMRFEADEGDSVLASAQAEGGLNMVLLDEGEREIQPVLSAQVPTEKPSVFARAYRITRKGVYRLRVYGERLGVTVIKFGRDLLEYVKRKGDPTRTTCLLCTKTLVIVFMLATHAYVIPAGQHVLTGLLAHYKDAAALLAEISKWLPDYVVEFVREALEKLFEDFPGIPKYMLDPLGEAAKRLCKAVNWCPA